MSNDTDYLSPLIAGNPGKKLNDEELLQWTKTAWWSSEQGMKPVLDRVRNGWRIYNGQYDFSKKARWQAKYVLPKFKMSVRVGSHILKKALFDARKYFTVDALNSKSKDIAQDIEEAMVKIMDQAEFRPKQGTAMPAAFIEPVMVNKIYPSPITEEDFKIDDDQVYKINVDSIQMKDVRVDMTRRKLYFSHRARVDLGDFGEEVRAGLYRKEAFDMVRVDFKKRFEDENKEREREMIGEFARPNWRKEVELTEWYVRGLDDENGNRLYRDTMFTTVNDVAVARRPMDIPFLLKKPPFVMGALVEKPWAELHESWAEGIMGIIMALIDNFNLTMDANKFASAKAFEINLDLIRNPTQVNSGIYPGKTIKTRGTQPGQQAIREFSAGDVNQLSIAIQNLLDREYQNASGINEFLSGIPGVGSSQTATEVRQKSGAAQTLMNALSRDYEQNLIRPSIETSFRHMLQYNPEVFGPRIYSINSSDLRIGIRVGGISELVERQGEIEKVMLLTKVLSSVPQLAAKLNWDELGKKAIQSQGWDPREIFLSEQVRPPEIGGAPSRTDQQVDEAASAASSFAQQNVIPLQRGAQ